MAFKIQEFMGEDICVELHDGQIVSGLFDGTVGTYICIRDHISGRPYLFHERYIVSLYLRPNEDEVTNDDSE